MSPVGSEDHMSNVAEAPATYRVNHGRAARRRAALAYAHRSCDIEGLAPSPAEDLALQERWAQGEIAMDQLVEALKERYRQA